MFPQIQSFGPFDRIDRRYVMKPKGIQSNALYRALPIGIVFQRDCQLSQYLPLHFWISTIAY
jgi:hypothetical protein